MWLQRFDGHFYRFSRLLLGHCIFQRTNAVVSFLKFCRLIVLGLLTSLVVSFLLFRGASMNFKVAKNMTGMQISLASLWPLGHGNECQVNERKRTREGRGLFRRGHDVGKKKKWVFECCLN